MVSTPGTTGGTTSGTGSTTDGTDGTAGGTQVVAPIALPITLGGNAISVVGDSTTQSPTVPTNPTDPTDPAGPIGPTNPTDPTVPSGVVSSGGPDVVGFPAAVSAAPLAATGGTSALPALLMSLMLIAAGAFAFVSRRRSA
jgi:LPXTG-motif cell wall-anchored protein